MMFDVEPWQPLSSEDLGAPPIPLPKLVWRVLANRGQITLENIDDILSPSLSKLTDPFALDHMEKAVNRLLLARAAGEKVCVYADFDLDGTSGCCLLLDGLASLGFKEVIYYQPSRLVEGYGLHKAAVDEIAQKAVNLLITVDVGITAIEAVAHANALGLEVIITDHHLPKKRLPSAYAVVNPNKGSCPSGLGHLSGAGVAFYVILALAKRLRESGELDENLYRPKELLDCFAIGTLTDMVPLVAENRVLIKHGLISLERTKRPGLRALLHALTLGGRPLTSSDVAMRFAPKLNALSRLELGILPIELFLEKDDRQAEAKVAGVIEFNKMRMDLQKSAENSVLSNCAQRSSAAVIDFSSSYHRGVVGLVATKVAQSLGVPAFIGSVAEDGLVVGSARLPVGSTQDLTVILSSAKDVLDHFGGHAAAAGFTLPVENLDAFRESIELHLSQWQVGDSAQQPRIIFYDDLASLDQMDEALMQWYDRLEPFGSQFQIPIYRFSGVGISQIRELRGGHLKISLSQAQRQMDGLWFSPPKDQLERLNKLSEGGIIADIIAEPQRNYFRGKMSVQLLIHGMRLASA